MISKLIKKKSIIKIDKVDKEHMSAILHIADKQLGQDYINSDDFIQDDFIKLQASIYNKIVGFITAKELNIEELYKKIPNLKEKNLKQLSITNKINYIGSVATDSIYEGRGVATALYNQVFKELNKDNNIILMTGWKSKKGINIDGIAKRLGFVKILEVKEYWKEDSIKNKYDCPICKNPCLCSAIIYLKHNNSI